MQIECTCGEFKVDLVNFPGASPGRLVCYCDDCQAFLNYLGRADLMDAAGGSEIIPCYPADLKIVAGVSQMQCTRLSDKGMFRFSTVCCNSPIANIRPGTPWAGVHHNLFGANDSQLFSKTLGAPISRVGGKYAHGPVPTGTSPGFSFKSFVAIGPFILKGIVTGKAKPSPFFAADGKGAIVPTTILEPALRVKHTPKAAGGA